MLSDTFIAPVSRRMVRCGCPPPARGRYELVLTNVADAWRAQTNMSYVIWILAYNMVQLTALLVAELVWALPTQPPVVIVLAGLNDNGLALFLLVRHVGSGRCVWLALSHSPLSPRGPQANVMTGLVNMGMVTIYASQRVAYVVVCAYTGAVAAAAAGLYRRVKLKVW